MRLTSLRLRLLIASGLSILVALVLAGVGLTYIFYRHVEYRIVNELETYVNQIAGNVQFAQDGSISVRRMPADPRFNIPLSGLYWQVSSDSSDEIARSRSLWDQRLHLPKDPLSDGQLHQHQIAGPENATLILLERLVTFTTASGDVPLRIAAAVDRKDVVTASQQFAADMIPSLGALAAFLIGAAWVQITLGLKPLDAIRSGVNDIRTGNAEELSGSFPDEVEPLVAEVNELLLDQHKAMKHARTRAADLAHGLNTPLAVLKGHARRLRERGDIEGADELDDLIDDMKRHIDHQLALTRIQVRRRGTAPPIALGDVVSGVARTVKQTPRGERLEWTVAIPADLKVRIDRNELAEVAGNLIENASKWARSEVKIGARRSGAEVLLTISDDGPGIDEGFLASAGERGSRFDQKTPGTGLGLDIVREIAEAYGLRLKLSNRAEGGLRAEIAFPGTPVGG
jgi:signal transduction histidine kinase